jgi:Ras-related protein Rab-6A
MIKEDQIKLVLLGDSGVGKTNIVHRFVYDKYYPDSPPTIGATFLGKVITIEGKTVRLQIWDTAGQEKYRSLASMYYKDAEVAVLVYDITNSKSFEGIKFWLSEIKTNVGDSILIAIAANKSDMLEKESVNLNEAMQFAKDNNAIFKQTSAKDNVGIAELFNDICVKLSPSIKKVEGVKVEKKKEAKKKKQCC